MPLKILIDCRRIRDFGIGTYIRNLVPALAAIDKENRYILVSLADEVSTLGELPERFQIVIDNRPDNDPRDQIAFPMLVRQLAPDLCHIPVNRVPLLMPRPFVVTVHDMSSLFFEESSGIRMSLRRWRFKRGLTRADRVIAVSGATRRDVISSFAIAPDRVKLVYNAPHVAFFTHAYAADARAAGPESAARERKRVLERYQIHYPFLLYAGNIRPQKNIPRLVEAFAVAREQLAQQERYRDLRLIIIGDEISRYPSVRRTVIQTRVEHAVRFLGFVPFDTLRIFYEAAEAFVFPSLYEGFGLPPLEAMATGTPVITSNTSSLPEVVDDAAMLVNPENVFDIARGITEVLLDPALRQRMVERGRERAGRFSWERTASQVLEIYREVGERRSS